MLCTVLFCVAYFALPIKDGNQKTFAGLGASNLALGLALGFALLFIGIGIIHWARKLMADVEIVEYRHPAASSTEDRAETLDQLSMGLEESGIGRRPLVRNTLFGALGLMGLPLIVGLRDLGPLPGDKLLHTFWRKGTRIVNDVTGMPIKPADVEIGQLVNAQPEGLVHVAEPREGVEYLEGVELQVEKAKSSIIMVRVEPDEITFSARSPENWQVRRHHGLLQDLHTRGLPDLAVRAADPPRPLPLPPVDLRPDRRRARCSSVPPPGRSPSCRSRWTRRASWWRRATSMNPWARASGSVTPHEY